MVLGTARLERLASWEEVELPIPCSAGVFFLWARKCFARESAMLKAQRRKGNGASQKERGRGSEREEKTFLFLPSQSPFLLSFFSRHEIKDGGYNNTNINKKLSLAQNKPALQGKLLRPSLFREKLLQVERSSALTRATLQLGEPTFHTFPYKRWRTVYIG